MPKSPPAPYPEPAPEAEAPRSSGRAAPAPAEDRAPLPTCREVLLIEVYKGERMLRVYCAGGESREIRVALGRDPDGPKLERGDQRTPEGQYRIAGGARPSRFYRFIPIDYPSPADAREALAEGRLSPEDHARILAAHRSGSPPPQDTPLGGHLGFHGEGERWRGDSVDLDWTFGCVAMPDSEIEFLAERVRPGTLVRILP